MLNERGSRRHWRIDRRGWPGGWVAGWRGRGLRSRIEIRLDVDAGRRISSFFVFSNQKPLPETTTHDLFFSFFFSFFLFFFSFFLVRDCVATFSPRGGKRRPISRTPFPHWPIDWRKNNRRSKLSRRWKLIRNRFISGRVLVACVLFLYLVFFFKFWVLMNLNLASTSLLRDVIRIKSITAKKRLQETR